MGKVKILFLVLAGVALFFSCSNEDNDSNSDVESNTLLGTWKLTSIELDGEFLELHECHLQQTQIFQQDGIMVSYVWDEWEPCEFYNLETGYSYENGMLIFINDEEVIDGVGFELTNEVLSLTEAALVYKEVGSNFDGQYLESQQQIFTYTKVE